MVYIKIRLYIKRVDSQEKILYKEKKAKPKEVGV